MDTYDCITLRCTDVGTFFHRTLQRVCMAPPATWRASTVRPVLRMEVGLPGNTTMCTCLGYAKPYVTSRTHVRRLEPAVEGVSTVSQLFAALGAEPEACAHAGLPTCAQVVRVSDKLLSHPVDESQNLQVEVVPVDLDTTTVTISEVMSFELASSGDVLRFVTSWTKQGYEHADAARCCAPPTDASIEVKLAAPFGDSKRTVLLELLQELLLCPCGGASDPVRPPFVLQAANSSAH